MEEKNKNEDQKTQELKKILARIQLLLDEAKVILSGEAKFSSVDFRRVAQQKGSQTETPQGRIIEGVFDGQRMIGPDGRQYTVPPNYASKSKLVEGDMLKLTIAPDGTFLYKQIGPIKRKRIKGTLSYDSIEKQYYGQTEDRRYKLITAAVTYFKGEPGDEVIMLVPEDGSSTWAAIENIIKQYNTNVNATLPANQTVNNLAREDKEEQSEFIDNNNNKPRAESLDKKEVGENEMGKDDDFINL